MNPVIEFLRHAWLFHPVLTVVLGVLFFPEVEFTFVILALLFSALS